MTFLTELFDQADGTRLDQISESYGTWDRLYTIAYPNLIKIDDGRAHRTLENPEQGYNTLNGSEHLLNTSLIDKRSYVVEFELEHLGLLDLWGGYMQPTSKIRIGGRITTGAINGYDMEYEQVSQVWKLSKYVSHSPTTVVTWTDSSFTSGTRTAQLVLKGHTIEGWIGGVKRLEFRDESAGIYDDIGRVMIRFDSAYNQIGNDQTTTRGIQLNSIAVHTDFPEQIIPVSIDLSGTGNSSGEVSLSWTV